VKRIGSDINLVFHKVFCFSCGVDLLSDAFEIIAKSLIDQKKKKKLYHNSAVFWPWHKMTS